MCWEVPLLSIRSISLQSVCAKLGSDQILPLSRQPGAFSPLAGWQWGTDVPKTTLPCEAWTKILLEDAGNITAAWIPKAEHVQSM